MKFGRGFASVLLAGALASGFLGGCAGEKGAKHHMALNDENGFDTVWNGESKTLQIKGFEGKPFALFFFSTLCTECADQIPAINEILAEHNEARVYGVMDDTLGFDRDIGVLATRKVSFPTTSNPKSVAYLQNVVGGIGGTPVTVSFDANGKQISKLTGVYEKSKVLEAMGLK